MLEELEGLIAEVRQAKAALVEKRATLATAQQAVTDAMEVESRATKRVNALLNRMLEEG